jgi:NAD+ synthase (glutamine-hydrolysing)
MDKIVAGFVRKQPVKTPSHQQSTVFNAATILPASTTVKVATCNLNQWALDFDGNLARIAESIRQAKDQGCKYRLGPELEVSGYSCEDHFLELDTFFHCEQSLALLLQSGLTDGILVDVGCPMMHNGLPYNCRVFMLNGKIVLIRPKMDLADDGNYREARWFTAWPHRLGTPGAVEDHWVSSILHSAMGGKAGKPIKVPFGVPILQTIDGTTIASEICEELWTLEAVHIRQILSGVEIISNGSGSHHSLRKLEDRIRLIKSATEQFGGVYLYGNLRGCGGDRLYFDGCSSIFMNGELLAQASQFSLNDVELITAVIDISHVRAKRQGSNSFKKQSSQSLPVERIPIDISFGDTECGPISTPIEPRFHAPEEECLLGPACWLWDYLRRSGASGFLLPLSGGADSASVAAIVYTMCTEVEKAANDGNEQVIKDLEKMYPFSGKKPSSVDLLVCDSEEKVPNRFIYNSKEICNQLFHTMYLSTVNSSEETKSRAGELADLIGCYHNNLSIDFVVNAVITVFKAAFSLSADDGPHYISQGGTTTQDIALQNIQARLRMVMAYLCAQLLPWVRGKKGGFLLVLSAGNVDEALRGYLTKYDCSSADINPIGGISKGDIYNMLLFAAKKYGPIFSEIALATPTAELRPPVDGESQTDEKEMGMTYEELGVFGTLRKIKRCGPVAMFLELCELWGLKKLRKLSPSKVAEKVRRFFFYYAINRHKCTTLTPSVHLENYSPDDNRFDLRPFLYNTAWTRQFATIEALVEQKETFAASVAETGL